MEFKSNEKGKCPICNSENLSYGPMELEGILGNSVAFLWYCTDCNSSGKEWYMTDFDVTISSTGNTIGEPEVCPDCGFEIDYGTSELDGDELYYEYTCTECNGSGREYYTLEFDGHTVDGHEDERVEITTEAIDYKNDKYDATTAEDNSLERAYYGKNMTKRNKVRSLDQAKRNLDRLDKDPRVSFGQTVDQLSFEKTLNTDLDVYKARKDYAGIYRGEGPKYNKDLTINGKSKLEPTDAHLETADMWEKDAKEIADKIRAKHKKQEKVTNKDDTLKLSGDMKEIAIKRKDDDIDGNKTVDVIGKAGNRMKSIKMRRKKQEDVDDEIENDINLEDTISLLDIALSEIPATGIEEWGKDDELNFVADTKILFENLKQYEVEIPKYFYDNSGSDDWSNGIDTYLLDIKGIDPESGKSDNTYNWGAQLTHDVEFTMYETKDGCYFKASIHRSGDVRGNYTTEFLLLFDDGDNCYETIYDTCGNYCCNDVELDGVNYVVEPHFFNEYVSIWCADTQEGYDDVYCTCIEDLKEIVNKSNEKVQESDLDKFKSILDKIKAEPRSAKYTDGLKLRDEIVSAWKNKDLKTAYEKWGELYDLFSDGWDDEGNKTSDWNEEQNDRDLYELQLIMNTIESQCVYDVTDYGKAKAYREMGY